MSLETVALVSGREYRLRVRTRAFVISTAILVIGAVVLVVLTSVIRDDDDRRNVDIGVVDPSPALAQALVDAGDALDTDVVVVELRDAADAEQAVRDGDIDLAVTADAVLWEDDTSDVDGAIVRSAVQSATILERASELGIGEQALAELLAPVPLEDRFVEPEDDDRGARIATATIGVVLLFIAIQTYGNMVLMGVIEEKSSRVVEVLLNHLRPRHLLAGKVLGLGALGLTQMVLVVVAAIVALASGRGVDVPDVPIDALIWFVVWFVLGFALYATAFAMAGSLVSRQEDATSVVTPISLPFFAAYIVSFVIVGSPDSAGAVVLSLVPLTAPMIMPVRIAAGDPSAAEIVVSMALTVAAIYATVVLAGRVYARNILRTGARVPWGAALRGLRAGEG
ncbi:MAG TPA: ABC transporter permease [Acidimicrobiales bacterium]